MGKLQKAQASIIEVIWFIICLRKQDLMILEENDSYLNHI